MRSFLLKQTLLLGLVFCCGNQIGFGTDALYYNNLSITVAPQVDATNFLNEGSFDLHTGNLPFETLNTLNFTNRGNMKGSPGYNFYRNVGNNPLRAGVFLNEGSIISTTYLLVNATNITSPGLLSAGPSGLVKLQGNRIDLQNAPVLAANSAANETNSGNFLDSFISTNYTPESTVVDLYWGVGTNAALGGEGTPLSLPGSFTPPFVSSGLHEVLSQFSGFTFTNFASVPSSFGSGGGFAAFAYVDQYAPSNRIVQVVFVSTNDPNVSADVHFYPNGARSRGSQAIVQLGLSDTDVVSGSAFTNFVYFSDSSAPATNNFYQRPNGRSTLRPNPYDITLSTPYQWRTENGSRLTNITYSPSLIYNASYSPVVTNTYVGYAASIAGGSSPYFGNTSTPTEPTNSVGRVEILGDRVDLNLARIRCEGLLTVNATNFADLTQGALLDAKQISLSLNSTNQTFVLSNMVAGTVRRFSGTIAAWSAVWTNQTAAGDVDRFHVLILENNLTSIQPVTAYGLALRATNQPNGHVILGDDLTVARGFLIDAQNFTLSSSLTLPFDVGATNFPHLLNLTNDGTMNISGTANFVPSSGAYSSFVNHSNISAFSLSMRASQFVNSGTMFSSAGTLAITNTGGVATITNGQIIASTHLTLITDGLALSNALMIAGSPVTNADGTFNSGTLSLYVANSLSNQDTNSSLRCLSGFQLFKTTALPWSGDLLGTKLESLSRPFFLTPHIWTATDYGATREGYSNNAAVGRLVLDGGTTGKFKFSAPTSSSSAIYVDYLELKNNATNYASALNIDPNFTIYFANANLPVDKLNGSHTNHLRWVSNFAGPDSSTNVALRSGGTITVNRSLVESSTIDSDGDGIRNNIDTFPFDVPALQTVLTNQPSLKAVLFWTNGAANTVYTVDYTTNLMSWQVLSTVTTGNSAGVVTVQDPVSPSEPRFYRVRYSP